MSDQLRIVWDALDVGGYGPHGQLHDFRARCPGHDGENRDALHISAGAGGIVLLCCFAHGCSTDEIVEPLGLRTRDLFPLDPGDSGRRLRAARREDFTGNARVAANALAALEQLGEPWALALWLGECPNCERQHLQLSISSTGEPRVYCGRGCDVGMVAQALADLVRGPRRKKAA